MNINIHGVYVKDNININYAAARFRTNATIRELWVSIYLAEIAIIKDNWIIKYSSRLLYMHVKRAYDE